ncbi:response regulator [Maritimibacter sp. HL-12]|uniref:response regulator transcription factor n=1 Tax=Maritimibacter sp. HL-12 TaxID=1162418 RepID=UPI000A0F3272|nr:response regulator transcription factor [Maritimibacter sp. HL-12]SMH51276.1 two component transcriptional regulator, LuxR family [Maritimibacter sp. HL-12]
MCAKILIADDHSLVRELIADSIVSGLGHVTVSASDLNETKDLIEGGGPFDLILLDYDMPGVNGIAGINEIIENSKGAPVAILSGIASRSIVEEALKLGAKGFVPKTLHIKSMLAAIDFMIAGEVYAPFDFMIKEADADPYELTGKEKKVLGEICKGKANKEIAREHNMSESSVKMHVRSLSRKMNARNRTQLALIALEKEIV